MMPFATASIAKKIPNLTRRKHEAHFAHSQPDLPAYPGATHCRPGYRTNSKKQDPGRGNTR